MFMFQELKAPRITGKGKSRKRQGGVGLVLASLLAALPAGVQAQADPGAAAAAAAAALKAGTGFREVVQSVGGGIRYYSDDTSNIASPDPDVKAVGQGVNMAGPSLDITFTYRKDRPGRRPLYLEWESNNSWAAGTSRSIQSASDDSGVFFAGGSTENMTVNLTTTADSTGAQAVADVTLTDSAGGTTSIYSSASSPSGGGSAISQWAFSPSADGGVYVALTTDGDAPAAAAYGLLYDDLGFGFFGVGDVGKSTVNATYGESLFLTRQRLTLSTVYDLENDWIFSPRAGPTFMFLDRKSKRSTLLDIDKGNPAVADLPDIGIFEAIRIQSGYLGATVGASFSRRLDDTWVLDLSGDIGVTRYRAWYNGRRSVLIDGVSSSGELFARDSRSGTAYIGQLKVSLARQSNGNALLRLSLAADYISKVPYVLTSATGISSDGSSLIYDGSSTSPLAGRLKMASVWSPSIQLSYIIRF